MTFNRLFDAIYYQLEHYPTADSVCYKEQGTWLKYSTEDVINIVNQLSCSLLAYGIQPDDKVAIIANNRPEWNFVDLALQQIGAVSVPMYPTISEKDYLFIFKDANIKLAFVSDWDLYTKINNIKQHLPLLQGVYSFNKMEGAKHWRELLELATPEHQKDVDTLKEGVNPSQLVTIIYTSGTTGDPKGVMLSHNNVVSNVKAVQPILPVNNTHRSLSFLPLCHIFERVVFFYYAYVGVSIYYAESIETLGENLKEVQPHFFSCVPRLLEKVYGKIVAKGHALTGVKKSLFFWAHNLGMRWDENGNNGMWYDLQLAIANKIIFNKWREALGGRVIGIVTGAAALQPRLCRVFNAAQVQVREGYGQTETSPVVSFNLFEKGGCMVGSIGKILPGVEVRLSEKDSEILVKGPNVMMGYYNRPDLTAEAIDADGWLHTGDVGTWVNGTFLKITDRLKELFKTSGGKYVAPQVIENMIKEFYLVEQTMVIGADKNFVSALIVPNYINLEEYCKNKGLSHTTKKIMCSHAEVKQTFDEMIAKTNTNFGKWEQVKKYELMQDEWSIEGGELTPTMKVKRKVILTKYATHVDAIYAGSEYLDKEITVGA